MLMFSWILICEETIFLGSRSFGCFLCHLLCIYGWFIYSFFFMWFCDYIIILFFIMNGNVLYRRYAITFCWSTAINCSMVGVICWNYPREIINAFIAYINMVQQSARNMGSTRNNLPKLPLKTEFAYYRIFVL